MTNSSPDGGNAPCTDFLFSVGVSNMKIRIRIGAVLLAVSYLATILSMLLSCQPFHRLWQIYPDPGSQCLRNRLAGKANEHRFVLSGHLDLICCSGDNAQCFDRLLFDVGAATGKCSSRLQPLI